MTPVTWVSIKLGFPSDGPDWQRRLVVGALLVFLMAPIFVEDLYPFSRFPMFSDAPRSLVRTMAYDREGRAVALGEIGIFPVYAANPTPQLNLTLQRPIDAAYRFWTPEEFAPLVQARMKSDGIAGPIVIRQELLGPLARGNLRTVGVVAVREWEVDAETVSVRE